MNTLKNIIIAVLSFIAGIFAVKILSEIKKVRTPRQWESVTGHKNKIFVVNAQGKKKITRLPKDPETQQRVKKEDILFVGLTKYGDKKKEKANVQLKHKAKNRRLAVPSNDSGSDMDIE